MGQLRPCVPTPDPLQLPVSETLDNLTDSPNPEPGVGLTYLRQLVKTVPCAGSCRDGVAHGRGSLDANDSLADLSNEEKRKVSVPP